MKDTQVMTSHSRGLLIWIQVVTMKVDDARERERDRIYYVTWRRLISKLAKIKVTVPNHAR